MGNYALRNALQALYSDVGGKLPRLFDTIFLVAADEDNDAFEQEGKLMRLPDMAQSVYVYLAANDAALSISDTTKVFRPIGHHGPAHAYESAAEGHACGLRGRVGYDVVRGESPVLSQEA